MIAALGVLAMLLSPAMLVVAFVEGRPVTT
jgi:hypothetical protein